MISVSPSGSTCERTMVWQCRFSMPPRPVAPPDAQEAWRPLRRTRQLMSFDRRLQQAPLLAQGGDAAGQRSPRSFVATAKRSRPERAPLTDVSVCVCGTRRMGSPTRRELTFVRGPENPGRRAWPSPFAGPAARLEAARFLQSVVCGRYAARLVPSPTAATTTARLSGRVASSV